jgi:uncharacterized membrane protein
MEWMTNDDHEPHTMFWPHHIWRTWLNFSLIVCVTFFLLGIYCKITHEMLLTTLDGKRIKRYKGYEPTAVGV